MKQHSAGGKLDCPSAQPSMADARVLGAFVETAEGPRLAYLNSIQPVTDELLGLTGGVEPGRVMRFAAGCEEGGCMHFDGTLCRLATRIVDRMQEVYTTLPPCTIRRSCRWYAQERSAACFRCPQVVTYNAEPSAELREIARPAQ